MNNKTTHGDSRCMPGRRPTRLYNIWNNMKARCYRHSSLDYHRYGGRGISICKEWVDSYMKFKEWALNNRYKDYLTIDRVDNNKGYEPGNCRWITKKENTAKGNRETKRKLTFNQAVEIRSSVLSQVKLAKIYGVHRNSIRLIILNKTYKEDCIHVKM
ncbi:hypothetical protein DRH27_03745 [Candidatus Falkowbacteria bacterium]|nr:MAG: hypothetical protein DRH27_03745 [Candidatus Falkowbacteria bacterium]